MKMRLNYPVYPDLKLLPKDNRIYACWYYYTLAQQLFEKLGESTDDQFGLLEGDLWLQPNYERIARSVAVVYGFVSPEEFMKESIWSVITDQAIALRLPIPAERYMRPLRIQMVGSS